MATNDSTTYLINGFFRIGICCFHLTTVFLALSALGFISVLYDLVFWTDIAQLRPFESCLGQVTNLFFLGLTQTLLFTGALALSGLIMTGLYDGILHIGGYRKDSKNDLP